jgi:signal transduction histidine kinase
MMKFKLQDKLEPDVETTLSRDEQRAEADHDLARRSISGVFSYFLPWLIIYYASGLELANQDLLEFLGFMLAAASVGRLYLAWNFNKLYAKNPVLWRWLFSIESILSAAVWGGVSVLALNYDGMGTTTVMVMLSTAVIAAGGIVSLAPAAWLGGVFVVLLFLPIVPYMLFSVDVSQRGVALLFLAFFILMFLMWYRLRAEYWRALSGRSELKRAKEAAEEANIAKGLFIANVSHELRTPLTAIIGSLGMVNSYLSSSLSAETKTMVDVAYQNSKRLSVLINDILDFEKLNANRMEFHYQPVELMPFLKQAIELNHSFAEGYGVSFVLQPPAYKVNIIADEQRLMQVMSNLLSNAAKHSPAGKSVLVSVEKNTDKVRVSVIDSGEGVPPAFHPHIFEKFAQAERVASKKITGTGLGLAISKAIIEQMGGVIGFDSVVGKGATFYFDLPLAESDHRFQEVSHT